MANPALVLLIFSPDSKPWSTAEMKIAVTHNFATNPVVGFMFSTPEFEMPAVFTDCVETTGNLWFTTC